MSQTTSQASIHQALNFHKSGQLDKAERLYNKLLKKNPEHVDALHFKGVLAFNRSQYREAVKLINRAIKLNPRYSDAHLNLGNVLLRLGDIDQAKACYEKTLEIDSSKIQAASNLGVLYRHLGDVSASKTMLQQVVSTMPTWGEAHYNLANTYLAAGAVDDAKDALDKAIEHSPQFVEARKALLFVCYASDDLKRGEEAIHRWELDLGASPMLTHMRAAYSGDTSVTRTSSECVATMFNNYSANFESSLAGLNYRGPQVVAEILKERLHEPNGDQLILDAGCGTGLACSELSPFAKKLIGIDLSPGMLTSANQKGSYQRLIQGDLEQELFNFTDYFDVAVSIDALIYLGDLSKVFKGMHQCMKPGALFISTYESADSSVEQYKLMPHGRYQHSQAYLESTMSEAGFTVEQIESISLREELRKPVDGYVVVATKEQ